MDDCDRAGEALRGADWARGAWAEEARRCHPTLRHPLAVVLGSGLAHLGTLVRPVRRIPYADIEGFPESARPIPGHEFEVTVGTIDDVPVVVYPGRIHLYQGYSAGQITSIVRHAASLGCRSCLLTCATGAVAPNASCGLGIVTDHINLSGANPLGEWREMRGLDTPFQDMSDAYSPYLRSLARRVADELGIEVGEGVYCGVPGPSFETPAEVRALASLGVSYVGMSLVNEVIMARALGMDVLAITLATNAAGAKGTSHASVLADATNNAHAFERLVRGILALL